MPRFSELITNEWAVIIVACIAAISSVGTILITKYYERKAEKTKTKEKQYIDFLSNITKYKAGYMEAKKSLNECAQVLYLVGNKNVVKYTKQFMDFLVEDSVPEKEKQDILFAKLIRSMRIDLYGWRKAVFFPNKIGITTFR